jgi:hypothetical protein
LKSLVEKNAEYFYNQALKRQERDKDNAEYTACESCGRTIYLQRKRALERWRELKKREKNARESDRIEKEGAEQYLGALPQSRGVGAPPGIDLRSSDDTGLLALGKLPSSKNGKQYMNICCQVQNGAIQNNLTFCHSFLVMTKLINISTHS